YHCSVVSDLSDCESVGSKCHTHAKCLKAEVNDCVCVCRICYQEDGLQGEDIDKCVTGLNGCHPKAHRTTHWAATAVCVWMATSATVSNVRTSTNARLRTEAATPMPSVQIEKEGKTAVHSYDCSCRSGYRDGRECTDIGECVTPNICPASAACVIIVGSFYCNCLTSHIFNDSKCMDLDECAIGHRSPFFTCANFPGSFTCKCREVYRGNGITCEDLDKCSMVQQCHSNALCTNLAGTFNCSCQVDYSGDGVIQCADVNWWTMEAAGTKPPASTLKATAPSEDVDPRVLCANVPGDFSCSCQQGFTGDGFCWQDVDECALSNATTCPPPPPPPHPPISECVNSPGAYVCSCMNGTVT
ncbi:unnamed protein product, partial [Coregonus sp. 'balchen']